MFLTMKTARCSRRAFVPRTVSCKRVSVKSDDRFLLCSDGLTDMLEDAEIREILYSQEGTQTCAAALYHQAMQHGGKDNISVILVEIEL